MDNVCKAVDEKVSTIPCVSRPSLILVVPLAQRCLILQIRRMQCFQRTMIVEIYSRCRFGSFSTITLQQFYNL
ncbi:hypothetical protein T01_10045 [Trichinella spiralis]|uniref:Uncharacterized protein n=1 Tax=Trichinella spiralis TaxID=6334 RepID=A0A0V1ABE8_TRISP|nr:hypothetical protein T01_10045 [Trichinella spiralis]